MHPPASSARSFAARSLREPGGEVRNSVVVVAREACAQPVPKPSTSLRSLAYRALDPASMLAIWPDRSPLSQVRLRHMPVPEHVVMFCTQLTAIRERGSRHIAPPLTPWPTRTAAPDTRYSIGELWDHWNTCRLGNGRHRMHMEGAGS